MSERYGISSVFSPTGRTWHSPHPPGVWVFSVEGSDVLQWRIAQGGGEHRRIRTFQHLAHQTAAQVSHIAPPHPLDVVTRSIHE
jgi:hypothetical protein